MAADLHLVVGRPRNSSSPSGSQRARSPVRYSAGPGATGRRRSRPRSARAGRGSRGPRRRRRSTARRRAPAGTGRPARVEHVDPLAGSGRPIGTGRRRRGDPLHRGRHRRPRWGRSRSSNSPSRASSSPASPGRAPRRRDSPHGGAPASRRRPASATRSASRSARVTAARRTHPAAARLPADGDHGACHHAARRAEAAPTAQAPTRRTTARSGRASRRRGGSPGHRAHARRRRRRRLPWVSSTPLGRPVEPEV